MSNTTTTIKTKTLVLYALFTAIIALLSFTPLGYLTVGAVDITFLTVPVVIGATLLGYKGGAFLGLVFGISSFMSANGIGMPSQFGAVLLSISWWRTAILCIIPRTLMGFLTGLIFELLCKNGKKSFWKIALTSLIGPVLNTLLFMSTLFLLFGNSEYIMNLRGGANLLVFAAAFVGVNGLIEAAVSFVVSTAVSKALFASLKIK